jgi:tryptophan-rich sensory protein
VNGDHDKKFKKNPHAGLCCHHLPVSRNYRFIFHGTGNSDMVCRALKTWITPPAWVFGPVWTVLYVMMGCSLFLILQAGTKKRGVVSGLILFGLQLVLNTGWSLVFFGLHSPLLGFAVITALFFVLLAAVIQLFRFSAAAGALLIPYLAWVGFATYLNYAIMLMNP